MSKIINKPMYHEVMYDTLSHVFIPTDDPLRVQLVFGTIDTPHIGYLYLELCEDNVDYSIMKMDKDIGYKVGFTAGSMNLWSKSMREYFKLLTQPTDCD